MRLAGACSALLMLSGCAAFVPTPDMLGGAVTCVSVDTLPTRTTTVYISSGQPGTIVVQPDCTIAISRP